MPSAVSPIRIELTDQERAELERVARSWALPHRNVVRAKIVLLLADGRSISGAASDLGQERRIVRKWAERFVRKRLRGLEDAPRTGGPPVFSPGGHHADRQARVRDA